MWRTVRFAGDMERIISILLEFVKEKLQECIDIASRILWGPDLWFAVAISDVYGLRGKIGLDQDKVIALSIHTCLIQKYDVRYFVPAVRIADSAATSITDKARSNLRIICNQHCALSPEICCMLTRVPSRDPSWTSIRGHRSATTPMDRLQDLCEIRKSKRKSGHRFRYCRCIQSTDNNLLWGSNSRLLLCYTLHFTCTPCSQDFGSLIRTE